MFGSTNQTTHSIRCLGRWIHFYSQCNSTTSDLFKKNSKNIPTFAKLTTNFGFCRKSWFVGSKMTPEMKSATHNHTKSMVWLVDLNMIFFCVCMCHWQAQKKLGSPTKPLILYIFWVHESVPGMSLLPPPHHGFLKTQKTIIK